MPGSHARPRTPTRARLIVAMAVLFAGLLVGGGAAQADDDGHRTAGHDRQPAAAPNPNCTLIVPPAPLTAAGLATPYRLTATNRAEGRCHERNATQSAFVEATILDPATGALSTYGSSAGGATPRRPPTWQPLRPPTPRAYSSPPSSGASSTPE